MKRPPLAAGGTEGGATSDKVSVPLLLSALGGLLTVPGPLLSNPCALPKELQFGTQPPEMMGLREFCRQIRQIAYHRGTSAVPARYHGGTTAVPPRSQIAAERNKVTQNLCITQQNDTTLQQNAHSLENKLIL